ncbi:dihydrofolate reductase [Thermomonas sp. S9]|nr:dihydrofolate reductase [Thermomonas sp. S9]
MPAADMRLSLIAALDRNRAIGRGNALPWHLPDDFKRFRLLTLGKPVLMGRRTAESLGRALPGRRNLVLTRGGQVPFPEMQAVASLEQARALAAEAGASELCVIGGAQVYALALPQATHLHLTYVETAVEGRMRSSRRCRRDAGGRSGAACIRRMPRTRWPSPSSITCVRRPRPAEAPGPACGASAKNPGAPC